MRRALLILLLLALVPFVATAQQRLPNSLGEFYSYGDNYFIEITTLPGTVPGKGRGVVTFRLTNDLMTFRKTSRSYQKGSLYIATPTLYLEAINAEGVIVDRATWRDTARAADFEKTNSKTDFLCGSVELALRPGIYTIKYIFDDGTPGNGFSQTTQAIRMDDFESISPAIGLPVFVRSVAGDTLVPTAIDGAALFGKRIRLYLPLSSGDAPKEVRYELLRAQRGPNDPPRVVDAGRGKLLGNVTLSSAIPAGNDLQFIIRHGGDSSVPPHSYGAMIETSTDDLDVGDYIMAVTYDAGFGNVTDSVRFKLRWIDMPFSLSRPEYAIKALYPIATDETIDSMLSGDRDRQRASLDAFWARLDPTPSTKYNEKMAEYYRRVDYAFFNFKSIGENDGTFTDRGKIYMLNGPPSNVEREMQPDGPPREVWLYRNAVAKRFIFVDESRTGEYHLVEYSGL
jgi:GWxTD domain-containing protein